MTCSTKFSLYRSNLVDLVGLCQSCGESGGHLHLSGVLLDLGHWCFSDRPVGFHLDCRCT